MSDYVREHARVPLRELAWVKTNQRLPNAIDGLKACYADFHAGRSADLPPPISVIRDFGISDGNHRLTAARAVGAPWIDVVWLTLKDCPMHAAARARWGSVRSVT